MESEILHSAMIGALAADAVAMPIHWYYDVGALDRDYGTIRFYEAPRNPHPDSILWRSRYTPRNKDADILHDQAQYWGKRGVHYHQFLKAGENTLNFRLGVELYRQIVDAGSYDPDQWLKRYAEVMRTPGWHRDTYVEEYHRAFFDNLAQGKDPRDCGLEDIHIGGLTPVPFLLAALTRIGLSDTDEIITLTQNHIALTHHGEKAASAAEILGRTLLRIASGESLSKSIFDCSDLDEARFEFWAQWDDRVVIGKHLTPACYLPDSMTASLYLAWKYADDFEAGILANAHCGGDNCHRGAVAGALLGAADGVPGKWRSGLANAEKLARSTL